MNVDIKNAYENAKEACRKAGIRGLDSEIDQFIRYISIEGGSERSQEFFQTYAGGRNLSSSIGSTYPETKTLEKADEVAPEVVSLILDLYTVLGKYYILNRADKPYINAKRFVLFIQRQKGDFLQHWNSSALSSWKDHTEQMSEDKEILERDLKDTLSVDSLEPIYSTKTVSKSSFSQTPKEKQQHAANHNDTQRTENQAESEQEQVEEESEESFEELIQKLNDLIGLDSVKEEVNQVINLIHLWNKGKEFGEEQAPLSLHMVFYGNPGTGKTTVARLLAKIYRALGVLSGGQLVEVDRGGLVGGYIGQTALKTQEVIDKAMGGILFIDEAYALTHGKGKSDFGQEAVDTILKAMEDHRDDFIVIVAGYPDLMKEFISSNPGLQSRFNQYINFEDYTPEQLKAIFVHYCDEQNLILADGCDEFLLDHFRQMYENRTENYANGRDVRNYFEQVTRMRANRLKPILDMITKEEYLTIVIDDLENATKAKNTGW